MKSERLKKLESELYDLEKWMQLGLVPKKEIERHNDEMVVLKTKIQEEKERLQQLKESGEVEEFVTPRRNHTKAAYPESTSISDMDFNDSTETELDTEPGDTIEVDFSDDEREESSDSSSSDYDDENPFSDRNRWRRGGIIDPDANEW